MTINLTDPANHPANGLLTVERITRLIAELRRSLDYQNGGDMAYVIADAIKGLAELLVSRESVPVELSVWYGAMPETNGKTNWTSILHRKGQHPWEGITIDRSEYPDRVRYETDRMRHLIGELDDEPDNLSYDADLHSGYVKADNPQVTPGGWIPVSERMPEEGGRYWCYVEEQNSLGKSNYQWNCSWNGDVFSDASLTGRVTHWMPLPSAPKNN